MRFFLTALSVGNWFAFPFVIGLSFTELPVSNWLIIAGVWLVNRIAIDWSARNVLAVIEKHKKEKGDE